MSENSTVVINNNIVAIVQARMASTRLPGKVLADIVGAPMLARVVTRAGRANCLERIVVATSDSSEDDEIVEICQTYGFEYFRGNELDVLDRFVQAARVFKAEVIVRITGDCPLIDPALIDLTVETMQSAGADFAANRLPWDRTFPVGLDVEVCTLEALEEAWQQAEMPNEREHVMPYLYKDGGKFEKILVRNDEDLSHFRWTVDEPSDLDLVREIYSSFGGRDDFTWREILDLVKSKSTLAAINARVQQRGLEASN